jgi:hypothetical protein
MTVDELTEECVRFFLRTPEPRRPGRAPARRKGKAKPAR